MYLLIHVGDSVIKKPRAFGLVEVFPLYVHFESNKTVEKFARITATTTTNIWKSLVLFKDFEYFFEHVSAWMMSFLEAQETLTFHIGSAPDVKVYLI